MFTHDALDKLPHVSHGFFGRTGGVSKDIYTSLNCAYGSDDKRENITKNRLRAVNHIAKNKPLITPHQIHSTTCYVATADNINTPPLQGDGLITESPHIVLGILTADCAPILFADSKRPIVAAVHAGWKGALHGIINTTVDLMQKQGSHPQDIIAVVGPTIQKISYEVTEEFKLNFVNESDYNERFFIQKNNDHYLFDLPQYISSQLLSCDIDQSYLMPYDTYELKNDFFSYRRSTHNSEPDYGRQISMISLIDA